MFEADALLEIHDRTHRSLRGLLLHCRRFSAEELNREIPGFGSPTVRLQLHHGLGAARYWVGVLEGRIDADDDNAEFPTVASLEALREDVFTATESYLRRASAPELSTPRPMPTWRGDELMLTPAHVIMRVVAHFYHHQGQITAMCRLLGKPAAGLDYPHETAD